MFSRANLEGQSDANPAARHLVSAHADAVEGGQRRIGKVAAALNVDVRPVGNYGLPEHLRVTLGTVEQNDRFLNAWEA